MSAGSWFRASLSKDVVERSHAEGAGEIVADSCRGESTGGVDDGYEVGCYWAKAGGFGRGHLKK